MKLYKTRSGIVLESNNSYYSVPADSWDDLVNQDNLHDTLRQLTQSATPADDHQQWVQTGLLAPIGRQEVWASGVTYLRSRDARMEESKKAGGDNFYDRVYDAERPELFFKSTAERVVGPGADVRIRADSTWNVPEPELTLFITASGKIVGYTCGNDMSSRSIEGENPLYLPQAKSYDGSAALGPCLYVPEAPISPETQIQLEILRDGQTAFTNSIAISQMKRQHTELVSFLFRECSFPYGCFLMTGTGIVPPDSFTLQSGDEIRITIDGIGTLANTVA
ncbi:MULTISPECIES: fumarylacetoacetate hydrolase family protein [Spirosoma]|uniref:Fumarylacetoacetate hydrolase family protein n=1 Tax=Spirosoma liriopis TaxID=2937440 RepID=A0ABT0HLP7_9BACT|nr:MULTISPECIES: fumarylacetoacetate hydrolase family protein [Spirosoma]MCK8493099.1 fumarylacetoacetate hydrolase family protein [Spirosoma liriopis]UHG92498.1 fumarylacetoacetate hydrolase family protein [Spirosoma oryzicola]